jgi:hypothetical protein
MDSGYKHQEGYANLVSYDLLNIFASTYLFGVQDKIITENKIISNGNCFFHALGYAYYASTDMDHRNLPSHYAVNEYIIDDIDPSYNITLDNPRTYKSVDEAIPLIINFYDASNSIELLSALRDTPENIETINKSSLDIKERVAKTIIRFKQKYNEIPINQRVNNELEVNDKIVNVEDTGETISLQDFLTPFEPNKYLPADDNSIYAAAFLLNKIICVLTCTFDPKGTKDKGCYNITKYRLFGPKNMVCTQYNILFVLHISGSHYETFYPDNEQDMYEPHYFIKPRLAIVDLLNILIITQRPELIDGAIQPPFTNHFEYYEFTSNDIPIDLTRPSNIESLKSEVTNNLNNSEELLIIEKEIATIDPHETDVDTLHINEALLARLIKENQELTDIKDMPGISKEDIRIYDDRLKTITRLIDILVDKRPLQSSNKPSSPLKEPTSLSPSNNSLPKSLSPSNNSLPTSLSPSLPSSNNPSPLKEPPPSPLLPPSSNKPTSPPLPLLPTSSNNPSSPPSTPKVSTPKKYSFYSKPRPVLNLPLTSTIPYTPYILRDRNRKTLQLNPLS